MRNVVICAGGPSSEIMDLEKFSEGETAFIGADKGALYLLDKGIIPNEAVGDFDSVTEDEYSEISKAVKIIGRFQAEKNETDTELAVERALLYEPENIMITGVTGGRLDHMESALQLLYRYQIAYPHISFTVRNKTNEFSILLPNQYEINRNDDYQFVSFFAFKGAVKDLTLTGFKYDVVDEVLSTGITRFTSNELVSCVCTIYFREGICLMVRSSDA